MTRIDLNADLGESFGAWTMGHDAALMRTITSANIACGLHAGDPSVMRRTVALAVEHGVAIGAHPGFNDLAGFGRREIAVSAAEVEDLVLYQVSALAGVAGTYGVTLRHVKAHGALYNMAARDATLAAAIARAVAAFDKSLVLFGLPGSALLVEGRRAGLAVAAEAFADRAYEADGSLTPRQRPGSVIHDPATVVERALGLARDGTVTTTDGRTIAIAAETLCVHGDTTGAPDLAARIRTALATAGVTVAALSDKNVSRPSNP